MNEPDIPADIAASWQSLTTEWLAVTDGAGRLLWASPGFTAACGLAAGAALGSVFDEDGAAPGRQRTGSVGAETDPMPTGAIARALAGEALRDQPLRLTPADGRPARWLNVRTAVMPEPAGPADARRIVWCLRDASAEQAAAQREQRLAERLEVAQDFAQLGLWERRLPSGEGTWDARLFQWWGLPPAQQAPPFEQALERIHPDDRANVIDASTVLLPGRYSQRYRVLHPDGTLRQLHSQWEIKTSERGVPERAVGIVVDETGTSQLTHSRDAATAWLKLTADLANVLPWRHDLASGRVHLSAHAFGLIGKPVRRDGVPAADIQALIHPDDMPNVVASMRRAASSSLPDDVEARLLHSDGSWRVLLMRSLAQRSADGAVSGFVGVSLDITEQRKRSDEAVTLQRRLESVAAAAGIGIWSRDPQTAEGHWNRQMFEITGRAPALGVPTLQQWLNDIVHPIDRDRMCQVPDLLRRASSETVQLEYRIVRPDGTTRWLENRFRLETLDGRPMVVGVKLDITDRRAVEDALRSADHRAALAARAAGIGTWEVDFTPTLRIEAARWDEQMYRLRGMAPRDRPPNRAERLSLVHPDDRHVTADGGDDRLSSDGVLSYEYRVMLPDGSIRWLASRSMVVRGEQQAIRRRVGVNWDVTESKNAEIARHERALAERENRAKSQFLSRMSHELRTPLNAVLGFTELLHLQASQAGDENQLTKLGHIRAAGEHLLALINDVLELSSLESGARLNAEPVSVAELAAEALPLIEPLRQRHHVELRQGRLDVVVIGDRRRLRQVFVNLLSNAVKYNRPGGQVWLEADVDAAGADSRADGTVTVRVRDNGRGISEQQLPHLFEPFNRLGVEREAIEGSGIGLVIVKALVEGMGGRVAVRSRAGVETVFELTLPGHAAAPAAAAAPAVGARQPPAAVTAAADVPAGPAVGQVLYIEDNPVNVLLIQELLASHSGVALASEATGEAGVARARTLQPDLVLVDMQLPDFDGFEVLRRLRADPATAGLPCVALSANAMPEDIDRALAAGFAAYWTKPIDFNAFLRGLQVLLASGRHGATAPSTATSAARPAQSH